MDKWQPLNDIYNEYSSSLETAIEEGFIDDPETAEGFIWPNDLNIHEAEKDDIKQYVTDRQTEIIERIKRERGFNPDLVAGLIFRSVLCGMMWERDRYGR